ncbi:MAG TPA: class I SAM-dependent methyltransferase [Cyanobacteria bacterium UBA8803]|nr:class I SAM-dependent methyltransferase [Cyanobacteria bacterium UBA9273]HBL62030.1 class I SAM-dependent methyltransferase [Cyanobacteria bacterium UBA8803]
MLKAISNSHILSSSGLSSSVQKRFFDQARIPFAIELWNSHFYCFGKGEPLFKLIVNDIRGLAALNQLDECKLSEAYIDGSLDITGDMLQALSMRYLLTDRYLWYRLWRHVVPIILGQIRSDRQAISQHYDDLGNEFYLTFLGKTRCYSQAVFERDNETLETAQCRKLNFAIEACGLKSGDRVLDVGAGWGAFTEHAGRQGIRVTSLTISQESMQFLTALIEQLKLPCEAINQHFLEHESGECYDAIVIIGVMEHLPNYPAVLRQCQRLLKPGGRVYLDASASRQKYQLPSFISRYIFRRNHSCFCLHDFLKGVAKTPFELQAIYNDRHSYFLTCKAWAENLEDARDEIIHRWGEARYRMFRLYLWGSAHSFLLKYLDAYRLILELPQTA